MTEYDIVNRDNIYYVEGEIDVSNCNEFKENLYQVVDSTEGDMVLNFKELKYIDSAGLGILVGTYKRLKELERKLSIYDCSDNIKKLFYITRLNTLIDVM
ncbi:MAG: STAS domain-containing protein [Clostridia bacterium]|nr:STAS domain-containing protein [Clostridia bacterium]